MRCDERVNPDEERISAALERVGPRLRQIRAQRGVTLVELATATGISKSTLSRLENGQRKASLELLLPLAQAYRVPLDDLVGAPEVGDPRIQLKAYKKNGRTVIPLTRQPGGMQAWKIIVPPSNTEPKLTTHDGYEWLYVLRGRLRLMLDGHEHVIERGEAAEFDTRLPHSLSATADGPTEIISIFSASGERMHTHGAAGDL